MKKLGFAVLSFFLGLVVVEGLLQVSSSFLGLERFRLFRQHFAESLYYASVSEAPAQKPFSHFDVLLGWRNFQPAGALVKETLNSDFWRGSSRFSVEKPVGKRRVVFAGDSFVYGWRVGDRETLPYYFEQALGPHNVEVLNFAVHGFGLDQIALVANNILPKYNPDLVVVGFIADDLRRSCTDFGWMAKKPYFEWDGSQLHLRGIPIPTPFQTFQKHQTASQKRKDRLLNWASKSKVVSVVGELALRTQLQECVSELNVQILRNIVGYWHKRAPIVFYHLDGKLPDKVDQYLKSTKAPYISAPHLIEKTGEALDLIPERHPDGHPKASLNRIYAEILKENGVVPSYL